MNRPFDRRFASVFLFSLAIVQTALSTSASAQSSTAFQQAWQSGTPVNVTGVLRIMIADDFARRHSELLHLVRDTRTGRTYRLRFEKNPPTGLRSGTIVTFEGNASGTEIYMLDSQATSLNTAAQLTSTAMATTSGAAGDQHTLVIIANFRDKAVDCLTTDMVSDLQGIMWTGTGTWPDPSYIYSVDALYREMSYGEVSFSGTVVGPYTINYSALDPCCDLNGWADAANAAAAADGVDLSQYPRKLYFMPADVNAGFSGIADLGKTPSAAFVFEACQTPDVFAHELGHNLGFYHAATPTDEYGDHSDVMSATLGSFRQVNAPHKAQLHWVPDTSIRDLTADGIYEVAPLELNPTTITSPQALRAFKSDTGEYYYLSYRQPTGFDQVFSCCYVNTLSVHRWGTDKTYLLAELEDGETYTDPVTGFSVRQVSHDSTSSTVSVHVGTVCNILAPTLTLSPQAQTGSPGSPLTYNVTLVNNDGAGCPASTFAFGGTLPTGWTGSMSIVSLQLAPGASGQGTLTVTSPSSAATATFNLSVSVSDTATATHAASAIGSYTVAITACSPAAPVVTAAPFNQTGSAGSTLSYGVSVTNRDTGNCQPSSFQIGVSIPSGWSDSTSLSALTLDPGQNGVLTVAVKSAANAKPAQYGVQAKAVDAQKSIHSGSTSMVYTIQDTVAPTAPSGLIAALSKNSRQVLLSWKPSSDAGGLAGYRIWRNNAVVATTTGTSWTDQAVTTGSTYTYWVVAYDAAGNLSAPSNSVTIIVGKGK